MLEEKRMTTPQTPVAAGVGQSQINSDVIISEEAEKDNLYTEKIRKICNSLCGKCNRCKIQTIST